LSVVAVRNVILWCAVAVLGMAVATTAPASADCRNVWSADLLGGFTLVCDGDGGGGSPPGKPVKPRQATGKQLRALRFFPSPAAVARARRDAVAALAATGNGDIDAELRGLIESGGFSDEAYDLMRAADLSVRDLGDVYSFTYILGWQIVHTTLGKSARTSDKVAGAVRKELRTRLALDRHFRRMGDARQQEYAERLAIWIAVLANRFNAAISAGDAAWMEEIKHATRVRLSERDMLGAYVDKAKLSRKGVSGDYGQHVPSR
jgi:hypothetical protein